MTTNRVGAAWPGCKLRNSRLNIYRFRMEREERQRQEQPVLIGRRPGRIPIRL